MTNVMHLKRYSPAHLENIKLRKCYENEGPFTVGDLAITLMLGEDVMAIFGGDFLNGKTLKLWALISEEATKWPLSLHRFAKILLKYAFKTFHIHRAQMSVRCDFATGWRWAKVLGFECEGIMKRYGQDGSNYWMFARTL